MCRGEEDGGGALLYVVYHPNCCQTALVVLSREMGGRSVSRRER
jgi:hypothetical protein